MSKKILFVQHCAKDFLDGTQNMDAITELAYRRICDLIYSTNDNLLDNESLQHMTKTGTKWKQIRKDLIEVHKKIYIEGGMIRNRICTKKLEESRANIEQKSAAGKAAAQARKALKEKETASTAVGAAEPTTDPSGEPTNRKPQTTIDDDDVTRAREGQSETFQIGQRLAKITGWENDPRWAGNYSLVQVWLDRGFDPELDIIPTAQAVMAKRGKQEPPTSLKYFDKAIAQAFADRTRAIQIPEGKNDERSIKNNNGSNGKSRRTREAIFEAIVESHGPGMFESPSGGDIESTGLLPRLR